MSEVRTVRSGLQTDWGKLGADCPKEAVPDCRIEIVADNRTLRFYVESKAEAMTWQQHLLKLKQVVGLKSVNVNFIHIRTSFYPHAHPSGCELVIDDQRCAVCCSGANCATKISTPGRNSSDDHEPEETPPEALAIHQA